VIEPRKNWFKFRLDEIWEYRELILLLAWRDVAVRYKQTFIGAAWAVAQPLAMMVMASVVFRRWAHMPSEGVPYPIFTFVALLPWIYFSNAMTGAASSLVRSSNILTKIYFPRLIIPIASVLPPLIDFAIGFTLLIAMLCYYGMAPSWRLLLVVPLLALTLLLALAVGIWISALSIKYRDLSHLVPFMSQLWLFASPIVYPADLVTTRWRSIYALNPIAAIIESFRWSILGTVSNLDCSITLATLLTVLLLVSGIIYFQTVEKTIADFI
jgi:lipopolysaccharide transport system permease protein